MPTLWPPDASAKVTSVSVKRRNGAGGSVAEALRAKLVAIQRGDAADGRGRVRRAI